MRAAMNIYGIIFILAFLPVTILLVCMLTRRGRVAEPDYHPRRLKGRPGMDEGMAIAEQRRTGRERGGSVTVVVSKGDFRAMGAHSIERGNVRWLAEHGPEYGIEMEIE